MIKIKKTNEIIILIHGLLRTPYSMARLARFLRHQGYQSELYGYLSFYREINHHAANLRIYIENLLAKNPQHKLHFITHSLGGILAREALQNLSIEAKKHCDCLIMLSPPNKGSPVAKKLVQRFPVLSSYIKPLKQLSSESDAYVHRVYTPKEMKIGVIAGKFDKKTPPEATHLKEQKDFLLVDSGHTYIMNNPEARLAILQFLQTYRFR